MSSMSVVNEKLVEVARVSLKITDHFSYCMSIFLEILLLLGKL